MASIARAMPKIFLGRWKSRLPDPFLKSSSLSVDRLWKKDPSLWKSDPEQRASISNRLGWLDIVDRMSSEADPLGRFAREIADDGFRQIILLGMGGSSLCAEVLGGVFRPPEKVPRLFVLDSTDPGMIRTIEKRGPLRQTFFLVSSKSGKTVETLSHFSYFYSKIERARLSLPGRRFAVITDAGSPLEHLGRERDVRRVFLNPSDIGGRYSALSYFGLVPAALMGIDIRALIESARRMQGLCRREDPRENPGLALGLALGHLARAGADKLTFISSPAVASLGYWIEQLIAESTGKEGKGIIPVEGERPGLPSVYGPDRVFVRIRMGDKSEKSLDRKVRGLRAAGFPIIELHLDTPLDLGGAFFLWEFAVSVSGAVLGINPFNEPNVQESKDNTERILKASRGLDALPVPTKQVADGGCRITWGRFYKRLSDDARRQSTQSSDGIVESLATFLSLPRPGDYLALLAFLPRAEKTVSRLDEIRDHLRDALSLPVLVGFGPRYLHSIGQLHKGGPDRGLFLQITTCDSVDLEIPGFPFTFGKLKAAQALGDFQALDRRGYRVLAIHLDGNPVRRLRSLERWIRDSLRLVTRRRNGRVRGSLTPRVRQPTRNR